MWTPQQVECWSGQVWKIPLGQLGGLQAFINRIPDVLATDMLKHGGRVEQAVVKMQREWTKYRQWRAAKAETALLAFVLMLANKRRAERQCRGTQEQHEVPL